jgi:hypothetical protein
VPCNPNNALTIGALSSTKLGTLGATNSIQFQGTLGAISFVKLQGTLGVVNSASLCSYSGRGAPNTQAPAYSTQGPTFGT